MTTMTTMSMSTRMKKRLWAWAFLCAASAGCGKTSYFEVAVSVKNDVPAVNASCLFTISSCRVTVSGAASDSFTLADSACHGPRTFDLGLFQYATDSDSGNVTFTVDIYDGSNNKLGEGAGSAPIKSGGRQTLMVGVEPDPTPFHCL